MVLPWCRTAGWLIAEDIIVGGNKQENGLLLKGLQVAQEEDRQDLFSTLIGMMISEVFVQLRRRLDGK